MKSLFATLALALVVAAPAASQDLRNVNNRKDAVLAIAQTHSLKLLFDTEPSGSSPKTDMTGLPWQEALTEVLTPYNRWYQTPDAAVHIVTIQQWMVMRNSPASIVNRQAPPQAAPQAAPVPTPAPAAAPAPQAAQPVYVPAPTAPVYANAGLNYAVPTIVDNEICPFHATACQKLVTDQYGHDTTVSYKLTGAGYIMTAIGGRDLYPQRVGGGQFVNQPFYGGSYGSYGNSGDWYGLPIFNFQIEDLQKRTELRWSRGQLKIKGGKDCDSKCLSNIHIVAKINGEEIYIAGAKFGNNWYEKAIRVPLTNDGSGLTKAEFWIVREMKETDGKMRGFVRNMFVPSMGETNQVTNLPISLNEFENAREVRLMNQHVLVEGEGGQFVAENRKQ